MPTDRDAAELRRPRYQCRGYGGGSTTGGTAHDGDGLLPVAHSRLALRAFTQGWPIPPAERDAVIQQLVQDCLTGPDVRSRAAAARALIAADAVNARREANSIQERQGDARVVSQAVRALAEASPEARQLLAQLSAEYARCDLDGDTPPATPPGPDADSGDADADG